MDNLGKNALYYAIYADNLAIVKLLIENGAELEVKIIFGLTPLEFSAIFVLKKDIKLEEDYDYKDELSKRIRYSYENGNKIYYKLK